MPNVGEIVGGSMRQVKLGQIFQQVSEASGDVISAFNSY
jgi:hypothetical protein